MHLLTSPPPGISAFPTSPDSLFTWSATILGPEQTVYQGIDWKLTIKFGGEYPIKAPDVKFGRGMWHPNVDLETGTICLDVLKVS
jgi:ubiquitin-conjugating enzyme E2 C